MQNIISYELFETDYFKGITDPEEAKILYRKLAKELHPEAKGNAGTEDAYKELASQYNERFKYSKKPESKPIENTQPKTASNTSSSSNPGASSNTSGAATNAKKQWEHNIDFVMNPNEFNIDYLKAIYQSSTSSVNSEEFWKSADILNRFKKITRFLPNGIFRVDKNIKLNLTSLRSYNFRKGEMLKFDNGSIMSSSDGVKWKTDYPFDMRIEHMSTNRGSVDRIYYTFYQSITKISDL